MSISNEEYNSIILKFYSQSFLQISLKSTDIEQINKEAMELTNHFVTCFHSGIAKNYVKELEKKHVSLRDKLTHYPTQFWSTGYGNDYFEALLQKITEDAVHVILLAKENNDKVDVNMLVGVVNDLMLVYEKDLKEGKKQLLKIRKELNTHKKIKLIQVDFMHLLQSAFEKHQKKNPLLKYVVADFQLII